MPKMKTKSSAKKRFKLTASGRVKFKPAGKRHGLSKRPQSMKRKTRRNAVMAEQDGDKVVRYYLPNGL
ncbi:MAG TPA: 50S ribosomal protein L35 [Dongiaceae bacterium]|nr:50S ribosomal protein L35 [Dongiaceae bacterium]